MNAENTMDETCELRESFNENRNYKKTTDKNKRQTTVVTFEYNEDRRLGEVNTHRIYTRRRGHRQ